MFRFVDHHEKERIIKPIKADRIHKILRYICISWVIVFGVISIIGSGGGGGDDGGVDRAVAGSGRDGDGDDQRLFTPCRQGVCAAVDQRPALAAGGF